MGMKNHLLHMTGNSWKGEHESGIHLERIPAVPKNPSLCGAGPDGAPRG
jgi:hypothetical protein